MNVHPSARCGSCGGRVDLEARCFVCHSGWLAPGRVDRLLADGVEINADAHDRLEDTIAAAAVSRLVRRFGVRRLLALMSDGAATMIDLAKEEDTGVRLEEGEAAALLALFHGLARAPERP